MNEWLIAIAGFIGAIIGAIVGFVGIAWQHRAQSWSEVRSKCAELLYLNEKIFDDIKSGRRRPFIGTRIGEAPPVYDWPRGRWTEESEAALRYLELSAPPRTYNLAAAHASMSELFESAMSDSEDREATVDEYARHWSGTRAALVDNLRNPRSNVRQAWREWCRRREAIGGTLRKILKVQERKRRKRLEEYGGF